LNQTPCSKFQTLNFPPLLFQNQAFSISKRANENNHQGLTAEPWTNYEVRSLPGVQSAIGQITETI